MQPQGYSSQLTYMLLLSNPRFYFQIAEATVTSQDTEALDMLDSLCASQQRYVSLFSYLYVILPSLHRICACSQLYGLTANA